MIHCLITSGGTRVAIDPIREISNVSRGQFGAALASAALVAGATVSYLTAETGATPFSQQLDCYAYPSELAHRRVLRKLLRFSRRYREFYEEYRYHYFTDYFTLLERIIKTKEPEIVILAAAVSDYLPMQYSTEKIVSSQTQPFSIQLTLAPKIIQLVKQWSTKSFLVGFKLLVNATEEQLVSAAMTSMRDNQADLMVANDLTSIQQGAHEILLVEKEGTWKKYTDHLAQRVIERAFKRWDK